MGRPINSRFFGPDLGDGSFQITGLANFDSIAEPCYIIRQRSNHQFEVASATGTWTTDPIPVFIPDHTMIADLAHGDVAITNPPIQDLTTPGAPYFHILVNGSEHAKNIKAHQVSTFQGNGYVWSAINTASAPIEAELGGDESEDSVTDAAATV